MVSTSKFFPDKHNKEPSCSHLNYVLAPGCEDKFFEVKSLNRLIWSRVCPFCCYEFSN